MAPVTGFKGSPDPQNPNGCLAVASGWSGHGASLRRMAAPAGEGCVRKVVEKVSGTISEERCLLVSRDTPRDGPTRYVPRQLQCRLNT